MKQCLFCLRPCAQPPPAPEGGMAGASRCKSLESQLLQHFVLRKLLDIPWSWCEDWIRRHGESGEPELRICRKCIGRVHEAWEIHQDLVRLEVRLKQVKEGMKELMSDSIAKLRMKNAKVWENEVRVLLFPEKMPTSARKKRKILVKREKLDSLVDFLSMKANSDADWEPMQSDDDCELDGDDDDEDWPLDENIMIASVDSKGKQTKSKRKYVWKRGKDAKDRGLKFIKCKLCTSKFREAEVYQNHLEIHKESKEKGLECEMCSYPARTREELEVHKFNEHDNEIKKFRRPFSCGKCEFKAHVWKVVKDHAEKEHPDTPEEELGPDIQLKCEPCNKIYDTANILINHQKKMHPELFGAPLETVQCDQCSELLPSRLHLQYHLRAVHKRLNLHICDLCGKGFGQLRRLERHKVTHEDKRDFVCHICGCSYSYNSCLSGHYRKFHPEYEHNPNVSASTSNDIKDPLAVPDEVFSCKYCDLKFPFKISLIRHTETHKETMGVQCELCFKWYVNQQGLKQHMKLYHPATKQETQCPHCLKIFSNPHAMHTHSMKHCKMKKLRDVKLGSVSTSQGEGEPKDSICTSQQLQQSTDHPHPPDEQIIEETHLLTLIQVPISS